MSPYISDIALAMLNDQNMSLKARVAYLTKWLSKWSDRELYKPKDEPAAAPNAPGIKVPGTEDVYTKDDIYSDKQFAADCKDEAGSSNAAVDRLVANVNRLHAGDICATPGCGHPKNQHIFGRSYVWCVCNVIDCVCQDFKPKAGEP